MWTCDEAEPGAGHCFPGAPGDPAPGSEPRNPTSSLVIELITQGNGVMNKSDRVISLVIKQIRRVHRPIWGLLNKSDKLISY